MTPNRITAAVLALTLFTGTAAAQSGLLTREIDLEPLTLASGQPLTEAPYELEAGKHYMLPIEADGSAELATSGPEFFRNVWINEVVVNDFEIRPLGLDSLEFDAAGPAEIDFIPIRPGRFVLRIPGTTGESQQAVFKVRG